MKLKADSYVYNESAGPENSVLALYFFLRKQNPIFYLLTN